MKHQGGRHRRSSSNAKNTLSIIALCTFTAIIGYSLSTSASADSALSPLEVAQTLKANCQLLVNNATNSAQRTRAQQCVTDQQKIIDLLTPATPTPTTTPTVTPTATPTPTPSTTPTDTPTPTPTITPSSSPTPTPTPTPTSGANNCIVAPSSCGFPDASSTGATGTLTAVNSDVTLSTAGATYSNKDVHGCITVSAANIIITNVKVTCTSATYAIINNSTGLTVSHTTINCGNRGNSATGLGDRNFTAVALDISGCENGFDIDMQVAVSDSFIHNLFDSASAHTDGAQVQAAGGSGSNISFIHNTWEVQGNTTSGIIADHCSCTGLTINNNLFSGYTTAPTGPAYEVYCPLPADAPGPSSNVTVTGNRFGNLGPNHTSPWGYGSNCGAYTWNNNVLDATGAVLTNPEP